MTTMSNSTKADKALTALKGLLKSSDESIRLSAAQTILQYAARDSSGNIITGDSDTPQDQ